MENSGNKESGNKESGNKELEMVCVVAMARNRVIGDGTGLIWHLPGDLKRVKALTMGCPLIMGRHTWDSIGRALPGRLSIVLTRNTRWSAPDAVPVASMEAAISAGADWLQAQGQGERRIILFGGGEIYAAGLDYCKVIEATIIDAEPESGVRFPRFDENEWQDSCLESMASGEDYPAFHYHRLVRKTPPADLIPKS
jgi:dihydrofolate reductase